MTDIRLMLLRAQLFTAMQQLSGDELAEFWQLIGDVSACRPPGAPLPNRVSISPNTAITAAEAIRRAHRTGPGHGGGDACEELALRLEPRTEKTA